VALLTSTFDLVSYFCTFPVPYFSCGIRNGTYCACAKVVFKTRSVGRVCLSVILYKWLIIYLLSSCFLFVFVYQTFCLHLHGCFQLLRLFGGAVFLQSKRQHTVVNASYNHLLTTCRNIKSVVNLTTHHDNIRLLPPTNAAW